MSKKFKGEYSELIFSSLACGAACLFGYLFCLILVKAGAIEFHMPFGLLFLLCFRFGKFCFSLFFSRLFSASLAFRRAFAALSLVRKVPDAPSHAAVPGEKAVKR